MGKMGVEHVLFMCQLSVHLVLFGMLNSPSLLVPWLLGRQLRIPRRHPRRAEIQQLCIEAAKQVVEGAPRALPLRGSGAALPALFAAVTPYPQRHTFIHAQVAKGEDVALDVVRGPGPVPGGEGGGDSMISSEMQGSDLMGTGNEDILMRKQHG